MGQLVFGLADNDQLNTGLQRKTALIAGNWFVAGGWAVGRFLLPIENLHVP